MGIYWQTYFKNNDKNILLASIDQIIDPNDIQRGYVLKEELLQYYGNLVKEEDVTKDCCLVEYQTCTFNGNCEPVKTRQIKVQ